MFNEWTEELEYLDVKKVVSTTFGREESRAVEGDFEVPEEALQEAQRRGLSMDIPVGRLGGGTGIEQDIAPGGQGVALGGSGIAQGGQGVALGGSGTAQGGQDIS